MRTPIRWPAAALALALVAAPAAAQEAAPVRSGEMEDALRTRTSEIHDDRAAVDRVLSDERVEGVVRDRGLDPDRLREAARGLEGDELARVAEEARAMEQRLVADQQLTFMFLGLVVVALLLLLI